ncbi:MAG: phosphoenolpyruvate--protein phosphotransferase [Bacteroidales bacterium]|nr:phosphoenolpyruvate--protein phosphotransferase [Bacteroidales bacterium]
MYTGKGFGIVEGKATGKVLVISSCVSANTVVENTNSPSFELERFYKARSEAGVQLQNLQEQSASSLGKDQAAIFEAQTMMLMDEDFEEVVRELIIKKDLSAIQAVKAGGEKIAAIFLGMENEQMRSKAADIFDLSRRLHTILSGQSASVYPPEEPFILLAKDLSPGELMQWRSPQLQGIVLSGGSAHSHLAILAAAMKLPCLISADIESDKTYENKILAMDASAGMFYLDPDKALLNRFIQEIKREKIKKPATDNRPFYLKTGEEIEILANIGSPEELDSVLEHHCQGIGLFRSEFAYLGRLDFPSEEELFQVYRRLALGMQGRKVVIRTLDIGADKDAPCFGLAREENPALGNRGIRLCLQRQDVFRTQLRAICRAAAFGNLMLMVPMLISLDELLQVKGLLLEVQEELRQEGLEIPELPVGAMIETPAAVMLSEALAKEAAFFSIGSNDLTQYTLAVDRQNPALAALYRQSHPAVFRMLGEVMRAAKAAQIPCSICGELAHDIAHTRELADMGFRSFSMAPVFVPAFKKYLSEQYLQSASPNDTI